MTKTKCSICGKKLPRLMVSIYKCRCEKLFCSEHKHNHNCGYDYTQEEPSILEGKTGAKKIDKI